MKGSERAEHIKRVRNLTEEARGDEKYLVIVEGTAWGDVLSEIMNVRERLPYEKLGIPGAEKGASEDVPGHGKPGLEFGEVNGVPVIRVKKMHVYANLSNPDAKEAHYILFAAMQESIRGAIITAGAGATYLPSDERPEQERPGNDLLKQIGEAKRGGEPFQHLKVGDVGVITQILPQLVQGHRHSFTGKFADPYHGEQDKKTGEWVCTGIHSHDGKWFEHAKEALEEAQGEVLVFWYFCTVGSDFEPPAMKMTAFSEGADAIGMSLYLSSVALSELNIPFEGYVIITNGLGPHSHEGNAEAAAEEHDKVKTLAVTAVTTFPEA